MHALPACASLLRTHRRCLHLTANHTCPPPTVEGEAAGGDVDATEAAALGMDTSAPEFYDPDADERDERWVGRQRRCAEQAELHDAANPRPAEDWAIPGLRQCLPLV